MLQGGSSCLDGDTLVKTAKGYTKIRDVKAGDLVYSVSGFDYKLLPVVHKFRIKAEHPRRKLITFVSDNFKIRCTYEHKFRINGEWVEAYHIARGILEDTIKSLCSIDNGAYSYLWETLEAGLHVPHYPGNNETSKGQTRIFKNGNGWRNNKSSSCYRSGVHSQPGQPCYSQSQEWYQDRQQGREPGMDDTCGQHTTLCRKWQVNTDAGFKEWTFEVERTPGIEDNTTIQTGHNDTQGDCGIVGQCDSIRYKGNQGWKEMETSAIKQIIISESNDDVYDLTVAEYHSYLITEQDILCHNSGKTYAALQYLFVKCIELPDLVCTVVGEDIPNLKRGALRDAIRIINTTPEVKQYLSGYNQQDRIFLFQKNSLIEFTSYEDEQDAKSGKRHILFVNEANGLPWEIVWQLRIRSNLPPFSKRIYDYNPSATFWAHDKLINKPGVRLFITDHRHNRFLTQQQHDEIEGIPDPESWRVYARGLTGNMKGLIYKNWIQTREQPGNVDATIWAIDYGYGDKVTSGKTAIIRIKFVKPYTLYLKECGYLDGGADEHLIKEVMLQNGWQNGQPFYSERDPNMIIAMRKIGMHILEARKGEHSEFNGIVKLKKFAVYYDPDESPNLHWERNHAKFMTVGDEVTKIVENTKRYHLLAALRYGVYTHFQTA